MVLTKILIAVKTYPTLSEKYDELVCTAGFLEDGTWIRLYPIPFRKLKNTERYKKWQWIELDITKNTNDFRKESYRPTDIDGDINILDEVGTENNWAVRKQYALKNVWHNMTSLISDAKNPNKCTSLAVLKPQKVVDFVCEKCEREWNSRKLETIYANQAQLDIFDKNDAQKFFKVVKKLPYEFSYKFISEDGIERKMMVEDWELGMLFWHCLKNADGNESIACQKVKEKYFNEMCFKKDIYFFLGTTKKFHNIAPNPFIIIGTFYPPKEDDQLCFTF